MKKLVKADLGMLVMVLLISVTGCNDENENQIKAQEPINGNWKLVQVANISDEQKYLNSILSIESNDDYTFLDNDGNIIDHGNWRIEGDYLFLESPFFDNGGEPKYRLMNLSSENLSLEEHYTLDNKNAYLEYHFTKVE